VVSAPTSLTKILAACLYIVVGWLAMKLVSSLMGPSAPIAAAVPLPQKCPLGRMPHPFPFWASHRTPRKLGAHPRRGCEGRIRGCLEHRFGFCFYEIRSNNCI